MIYRLKPAANVVGSLCQVDQGKEAFLTGWVCNKSTSVADVITVYALKSGETDVTDKELYSNLPIPANDTFTFTPIHLEQGESLRVKSQNGTTVFTLTGQEVAR